MLEIPALGRLEQQELQLEGSLGYKTPKLFCVFGLFFVLVNVEKQKLEKLFFSC